MTKKKIFLTVLLGVLALCLIILCIDKIFGFIYELSLINKYHFCFINPRLFEKYGEWLSGDSFDLLYSYSVNVCFVKIIIDLILLIVIVLLIMYIWKEQVKHYCEVYKKNKAEKKELKKQKRKEELEQELKKLQ